MASANPSVQIDPNKLLDSASKLATPELEKLSSQISRLVAQRREEDAPEKEKMLLEKIRRPLFSDDQQKRYDLLRKKQQANNISIAGHEELLALIRLKEQHGAIRIESMIELAKLWGVSFDELLEQLGMTAPFPEYD